MILKKYDPDADRASLPTHKDLPDSDGAIVDNGLEYPQTTLLTEAMRSWLARLHPDNQFFIGMDNGIYWKITEPELSGCKAPDWFYVPGVSPTLDGEARRSYVLWQEQVPPLIVIEYVSRDGKDEHDATPETGKFWVYEQGIGAEYYVIYDFQNGGKVEGYHLVKGRYRPMKTNAHGHFQIPPLQAALGLWQGDFMGFHEAWLRWFDLNGKLLPIKDDLLEKERKRIERERNKARQESQRADEQSQRAEKLAEKLRQMGIDPDEL